MFNDLMNVAVLNRNELVCERSALLAARLNVPVVYELSLNFEFYLEYRNDLKLVLLSRDLPKADVSVDFGHDFAKLSRSKAFSKGSLLGKAIGMGGGGNPTVFDATAGLGRDFLVFLGMGLRVIAVEKSPLVFELLMDGQARYPFERLRILHGDSQFFMKGIDAERPEVVYLDPMYPEKKKRSLPKKEMQLLQKLLGADDNGPDLFAAAIAFATQRVVVKRPCNAPPLAGRPTHSFSGKAVRFDMYLVEKN